VVDGCSHLRPIYYICENQLAGSLDNDCCKLIGWSCVTEMVAVVALVQQLGIYGHARWPMFGGIVAADERWCHVHVDKSRKPVCWSTWQRLPTNGGMLRTLPW
jgi:hypothetical protein